MIGGIQLLRGIAAMMVVLQHARMTVPSAASAWPGFGFAGVDIFFVISGFIMAHTAPAARPSTALAQTLRDSGHFIRKRIARVVPLYWLAVLWTARRDLAAGNIDLNLVKDFLFLPHPNPSYPDMLWPLVIQGWTLNYEMFFYLVFAVSILFAHHRTKVLLVAFVGIAALGWVASGGDFLRFYTDNIILEFVFGVLLHHAFTRQWFRTESPWVLGSLALIGFIALALAPDAYPRSIANGLPACLIVWSFAHLRPVRLRGFSALLGDSSYAIYLFHWASFGAIKPLNNLLPANSMQPHLLMVACLVVGLISGILIHLGIERPLGRWTKRLLGIDTRSNARTVGAASA